MTDRPLSSDVGACPSGIPSENKRNAQNKCDKEKGGSDTHRASTGGAQRTLVSHFGPNRDILLLPDTTPHIVGPKGCGCKPTYGTFPPPPRYPRNGGLKYMPISRNWRFLLIGGLIVAVAALGYKVYDDHRQPKGVQFTIGPSGLSVEKK